VTDPIDILIALLQKLKEPGWFLPSSADEMKSLFIRTVMGDYVKCFRCHSCGAKFITNNKPEYKILAMSTIVLPVITGTLLRRMIPSSKL
jgi:hypothetical protein